MIKYKTIKTPLGRMVAAERAGRICMLEFVDDATVKPKLSPLEKLHGEEAIETESAAIRKAQKQLNHYFDGKLKSFDLPLDYAGTDFQKSVWRKLTKIPYGTTVNYGWIAARMDRPRAARAVGQATGSNPISIVVPCHRVVGKNGGLVGYGGKMWRKEWLLEHEAALKKKKN